MKKTLLILFSLFIVSTYSYGQGYGFATGPHVPIGETQPQPISKEGQDFFRAIQNNDMSKIKQMVNDGFDIKLAHVWFGGDIFSYSTPLHIAAQFDNIDSMQYFLEKGADIDFIAEGETPLAFAAKRNNAKAAEFLLKHGASVDLGSQSPLWLASASREMENNIETMQLLVDAGADVNFKIDIGRTPLHLAVAYSAYNPDIKKRVDFLIKNGANINAQKNDGTTLLDSLSAFSKGNQEVGKELRTLGAKTITTDIDCKEYCYKDKDEKPLIKTFRFIKWNYKYFIFFSVALLCVAVSFLFWKKIK
jgi:hypothetical protein